MTHDACDLESPRCFSMIFDKQLVRMVILRVSVSHVFRLWLF